MENVIVKDPDILGGGPVFQRIRFKLSWTILRKDRRLAISSLIFRPSLVKRPLLDWNRPGPCWSSTRNEALAR
jgi:hypothetical protein